MRLSLDSLDSSAESSRAGLSVGGGCRPATDAQLAGYLYLPSESPSGNEAPST